MTERAPGYGGVTEGFMVGNEFMELVEKAVAAFPRQIGSIHGIPVFIGEEIDGNEIGFVVQKSALIVRRADD